MRRLIGKFLTLLGGMRIPFEGLCVVNRSIQQMKRCLAWTWRDVFLVGCVALGEVGTKRQPSRWRSRRMAQDARKPRGRGLDRGAWHPLCMVSLWSKKFFIFLGHRTAIADRRTRRSQFQWKRTDKKGIWRCRGKFGLCSWFCILFGIVLGFRCGYQSSSLSRGGFYQSTV